LNARVPINSLRSALSFKSEKREVCHQPRRSDPTGDSGDASPSV